MSEEKQHERNELTKLIIVSNENWLKEFGRMHLDLAHKAQYIADDIENAGYRKQSEVIDEFAKRLKEEMNNLSRMEYHCDPYFLVSKAFIDKIAEKMKGGE